MLFNNLKIFIFKHKRTLLLISFALILIVGGFFIFRTFISSKELLLLEDITLNFDPEGSFATLTPRRDGNTLIMDIRRIAQYDAFAYQITYTDDKGIDRGAGSLDTWIDLKDQSGDYEQEILLGTCSQGFTSGKEHCIFDSGVENGTLILRIRKGNQPYRMLSQWHLQKPDVALGILTSGDGHFTYKMANVKREGLALIGYTVVNDLTGIPKLPEGKQVTGKVYSLNVPSAKDLKPGEITLEIAENPPPDAKLARYVQSENKWVEMDTNINDSKLTCSADGAGIFAVLINKPK